MRSDQCVFTYFHFAASEDMTRAVMNSGCTAIAYETIKDAEPASPIYGFRNTDNRRRHFERLRRWPDQFLVIGDASCTFNPIYAWTNGNPKVNTAFVNVVNLRHPPASLLHPRVLLAVLAQHRAPPLTDPPTTSQADAAPT